MNLHSILTSFASLSSASTLPQPRAAAMPNAPVSAAGPAMKMAMSGDNAVLHGRAASSDFKWFNPGAETGIIIVGGKPSVVADKPGEKNGIIIVGGKPSVVADRPGEKNGIIIVGGKNPSINGVRDDQGTFTKDAELSMISLQSVVSQRQQAVQMTTRMTSAMHETTKQLLGNIR